VIFLILNATVRIVLSIVALSMIAGYRERFVLMERQGLALVAGSGPLAAHAFVFRGYSPYDEWAPLLFIAGVAMVFVSSLLRIIRHDAANKAAVRGAVAHLTRRGKLP
jgi:hypothetical protein